MNTGTKGKWGWTRGRDEEKKIRKERLLGLLGLGGRLMSDDFFLHAFGNWHIGRLCRKSSSIFISTCYLTKRGEVILKSRIEMIMRLSIPMSYYRNNGGAFRNGVRISQRYENLRHGVYRESLKGGPQVV